MTTRLNPYLSFRGAAAAAMAFYQSVFGGELQSDTFGTAMGIEDPDEKDLIMHSMLETEAGLVLMASDTPASMDLTPGTNMAISLSGEDEAELRGYWDKLTAGGAVTLPLEKAPWGDFFGMCSDQFGTSWMVNITPPVQD